MYKIKSEYDSGIQITIIGQDVVNLCDKKVKKITPATDKTPITETLIEPATQAQLEFLHKSGSELIEWVEIKVSEKPKA